ncbi:uncharacterized protein EDB93DRAFT_1143333 [Suillus bovinus]|uniref:uncharacterized protein n=1 Tax=Suillus bovinus TaxID=48563 RepID=UPI001B87487F|nr:uncharacterized protein EDB93DRAFT_1143333 [Suillus bovinus]KAG2149049.1 hypothetical protein EDB93DRAFT_1143333 [Suillus bovinus]
MPAIRQVQDATPSMQLTLPGNSQAGSVQSPATTQTSNTTSTSCSAALLANLRSREGGTIKKLQPKRRLKPEGPSIPEHIKNRDLQWFKAQLEKKAAACDPKISSPMVDLTAQPGTPVLLNNVAGTPVAEKSKPFGMPGGMYPRPPPSGMMTTNQPTATGIIHHSSTLVWAPASVDVKQPNEGKGECHSYQVTAPQANFPRFGGDMAVMVYRQGLKSALGTLTITFNFEYSHYYHIARWVTSKRSPQSSLTSDLEESVCISLACYHLPSLPSNPLKGDESASRFEILKYSQCSWPTSGDLSLKTKRDGKDIFIPLAPPIFVTPDNCVDISAFIRNGENSFSMVQQKDMSNYLFVFHAHHPTPEQLSYLASCSRVREEWTKSISDLCKFEPKESLWGE